MSTGPSLFHIRPFDGSPGSSFVAEEFGTQRVAVDATGSMLTVNGNNRLYLAERPAREGGSWPMQRYDPLHLLGKQLTFSLDVSAVGCSCNAAVYLVGMTFPGGSDGSEAPTTRPSLTQPALLQRNLHRSFHRRSWLNALLLITNEATNHANTQLQFLEHAGC